MSELYEINKLSAAEKKIFELNEIIGSMENLISDLASENQDNKKLVFSISEQRDEALQQVEELLKLRASDYKFYSERIANLKEQLKEIQVKNEQLKKWEDVGISAVNEIVRLRQDLRRIEQERDSQVMGYNKASIRGRNCD